MVGHVATLGLSAVYDDVPRGILWLAIVAPAAVFLIQRGSEWLVERGERARTAPPRPIFNVLRAKRSLFR